MSFASLFLIASLTKSVSNGIKMKDEMSVCNYVILSDTEPGHRPGHPAHSPDPEPELIAETELPADRLLSGSYQGHLNRPCLLHNGDYTCLIILMIS